ncbi:MAG TPA: calcium/proton exchanger [Gemmatimonadales bacterium]|nr:calcium/proton exchanger [Gemmatimonadales bacterium]
MNPHTLSASAQRALEAARAQAMRLEHDAIGAEHIVLALIDGDNGGGDVLRRLGLDASRTRQRLEAGGRRGRPRGGTDELAYTSHAKRLIEMASKEARESGTGLSAQHLLLAALLEPRGTMGKMLAEVGASPDRVRAEVAGVAGGPASDHAASAPAKPARRSGAASSRAAVAHGEHGTGGGAPRRRSIPWRFLLLLAVPVSIVLGYVMHAPAVWIFFTACLGVLPLAGFMGEATEHLAHRTGPTIGGLLNATFGNAAELIIAIVALRAGLVELVKASITGSILGNLLLILGLALIAGGTRRSELKFNRTSAGMSAGMLALSVVALVFPALYHSVHPEAAARLSELHMSEAVAVILILTYALSLLFTLKTHRCLFGGEAHPMDGPVWSPGKALLILGAATVGVAIESELLVHAATEATEALGLSTVFLGLIIIPIIGNAAEHAAAVVLSRKGQIDLGLQIALGSSTQIALLVAPVLVFAGVVLGQDMNLVFSPFEVVALGLATIVTAIITLDGESHWFEGVQLLAVYAMVAVGAFFLN